MDTVEKKMTIDESQVEAWRSHFPILSEKVNGHPLVYFDNAATSQKPRQVIDCISNYYEEYNSNVHRGIHYLSDKATSVFETARKKVAAFINAESERNIVYVRGCTEGINLVATSYGNHFIKSGDEVVISEMEHHSNIVPWQMLCERVGAVLKVVRVDERGHLDLEHLDQIISEKTKMVAINHISNALGTINPVKTIVKKAHAVGAKVLIDGAQATSHADIDVQDLGADFYVFSGHKMFAPTGIGVLYGKTALLESMPPYHGGGEMIETVTFEKTTYNELPYKFEAGTPNIAGSIALSEAIDFINSIGMAEIQAWESELLEYATDALSAIPGLKIYGQAEEKTSLVSFLIEGIHPQDLGILLDKKGIAIRTGHHCTQPLMQKFGVPGTCRASFAFYNTKAEIDALKSGIELSLNILK